MAKSKKDPFFVVRIDAFEHIELCVWCSRKALDRYVASHQAEGLGIDPKSKFAEAFSMRLEEKDDIITHHIYFYDRRPRTSVVFHECLHAAVDIMTQLGIYLSSSTEEVLAYLQGYLAGEIIRKNKKRGK